MSDSFRFVMATEIVYGLGASREIGAVVQSRGARKALVISDQGVKQAGLLEPIQASLQERGIVTELFDDIEQSSSVYTVDKGAEIIRAQGFDIVVAIGGGSAIDSGKAMGVVAANGGTCRDYAGANKVKVPPVPVIALPTTAGTSAEVTDVAVIADREKHARLGLRSPLVVPAAAVIDPLLTVSMPAHVTASTGMDALSHAIESYTNTVSTEITDAMSLEAIRIIGSNLRSAVANGKNIKARERMTMACVLIGMAYRNTRLGILHAITGPFCGYYEVPHGVANAVLLPHVMSFNIPGNMEKFAKIAAALGVNIENMSTRQAAQSSIEAVQDLLVDVGLPLTFKDMKLDRGLLPQIAAEAEKSGNLAINPRKSTKEDLLAICEKAF
ncbi:MAG: iron-containing alcohol dehydrogenase [Peptococcaceae bacterium]|nr:iron-containing alcohol dehydrogenase [Peptococcaceae bacterium]MDH7526265.1 iron-containing alcohol dehydrogenase [Peptococcaceae bacterium]